MKSRLGAADIKNFIGLLIVVALIVVFVSLIRLDITGDSGSGLGKNYDYEIDFAIDPNLFLYAESSEHFSTGMNDSHAIALDSQGSVYIAGDKAVRIFAENGNLLDAIVLPDVPRSLTVDDDGKIYVGINDHIEVYNRHGKQLASWKSLGQRALLTSIAVSGNNIFVADAGNRIILRYDINGNLINRIGKKDEERNVPGFMIPSPYFDLVMRRDDLLRVANPGRHRIEAYTFDGDFEFAWGKASNSIEGFCGCCNPINIAVLKDDSFVTCEKGLARIKLYDPEGAFKGVVAGPEQFGATVHVCTTPEQCQSGGYDVAVDARDRVFVLDTLKNMVKIFSRK
ncbi:MAG: NHL repeat-containing protein [Sedimentisphaerales bacterium]|nr:NHL repeat-containing protein [Sedimentisphaerales bacterium]